MVWSYYFKLTTSVYSSDGLVSQIVDKEKNSQ